MLLILFMSQLQLIAQDDVEYRMEFGAGVGMVSYEGDFNGNITHNMQPMASLLWRYNFNPYTGLKVSGSYGKLKGSSADVDTYYPDYQNSPYEFNNTLVDVSTAFEYNFWPYGTGRDYRGARRLTPFVAGGLGVTYVTSGGNNVFTANVPLGVGIKYKVGARLNVGLEWTMRFSTSDRLDVTSAGGTTLEDPFTIKGKGIKNKDSYSFTMLYVTFDVFKRPCNCNDER